MNFRSPNTTEELRARDSLLQDSLRPKPAIFPIAEEYPIVLAEDSCRTSICCFDEAELIAHANLWPRRLVDSMGRSCGTVGLVGNVATRIDLRGRGIMKSLFDEIHKSAVAQELDALILWSDLSQFYQKLGFFSLSDEFRWSIDKPLKEPMNWQAGEFQLLQVEQISTKLASDAMALRLPVKLTLERSISEFMRMLSIPATFMATYKLANQLVGYAIVGKGYDMVGVIHEWGVKSSELLSPMINCIRSEFDLPKMLLLTPVELTADVESELSMSKMSRERHPMALAKTLNQESSASLRELFIWGLDSI